MGKFFFAILFSSSVCATFPSFFFLSHSFFGVHTLFVSIRASRSFAGKFHYSLFLSETRYQQFFSTLFVRIMRRIDFFSSFEINEATVNEVALCRFFKQQQKIGLRVSEWDWSTFIIINILIMKKSCFR